MLVFTTRFERRVMRQSGLKWPRFAMWVKDERLAHHSGHAAAQHDESTAMTRARALMRLAWEHKRTRRGLGTLLSILMTVVTFSVQLNAQNAGPLSGGPFVASQINTITFQNSSGTVIRRFASPFIFKCDASMTCSVSGNVMTVGAAGGGGGASTADSFITINHDADLTGERVLAGTATHITVTDGGANNSVTLDTGSNVPLLTASNTYSTSTTQDFDTARAKFWGGAPIFDAFEYAGADMCAKIAAVYADAAFVNGGIIDARGFTGDQNCATQFGSLAAMSVKLILGRVNIHSTVKWNLASAAWTSVVAVPGTPSLSTSTTGGSLAAATQWGVKTTYQNAAGETTGSAEATITTGAGATNSITITSPTGNFNATCYNVYAHTPIGSGWLLSNTTGCVPVGTNYVIKTIPAGATIPASNTAVIDTAIEVEGQGRDTILSLEDVSAFVQIQNQNAYLHNMAITTTRTSMTGNGLVVVASAKNVIIDNLFCSGGNHCIFNDSSSNLFYSNIYCNGFTISASCIFTINSVTNMNVRNVQVLNTVWPAGGNLQGVVNMDGCVDCTIDGVVARNNDLSNITNAAAVIVQNSSLRTNIKNVNCDGLINSDCIAVLTMSLDTNISNVQCANTKVGSGAGIGPNTNNGDCIDLFSAGRVSITNATTQSLGLVGGLRFPCFEFFDSAEISATNINCFDSSGEGVRIFGSPGTTISSSHFNRNGKSGVSVEDSATVVTCNNTTTVVYVSGNGFGPWPPGTTVNIGAGPTAFQVASVASNTSLTLTAACNLGASQAFSVYSQDTHLTGIQADDNGQGLTGANAQSGISVTGHSQATIEGGSMNDNRATASKTQQFGISATTAGGQTSRVRVIGSDFSGNLGTTCSGIEYGANVAGNHGMCDGNKLSAVLFDDNVGGKWTIAASQTTDASLNIPAGTAPTSPVTGDVWFDGTDYKVRQSTTTFSVEKVVASGTATFTTTAVASQACQTTVTVAATNTSTNDIIVWSFQTAPVTATDAQLNVNYWPTSGNVNFKRCNPTAASITPTALVANWQVLRR